MDTVECRYGFLLRLLYLCMIKDGEERDCVASCGLFRIQSKDIMRNPLNFLVENSARITIIDRYNSETNHRCGLGKSIPPPPPLVGNSAGLLSVVASSSNARWISAASAAFFRFSVPVVGETYNSACCISWI